jgi:leader peptidase (prepilin peptidase)/N-methyltransferase
VATELSLVIWIWTFLAGLAFGSFLNVVIFRLPLKGVSIVRPRSHCMLCGTTIRWTDNLPVLSWLWLRGRCRSCGIPISVRYPLVELATGLAFAFSFYHALWIWRGSSGGFTLALDAWVQALTGCLLFFCLAAVSFIDLDRRIIPDEFTLPGIAVGILLSLAFPGAFGGPLTPLDSPHLDSALNAILGAAAGGGVVWAVGAVFRALLGKEAMGFGDVKLLAMIGAFVSWDGALWTLVLASIIGSVCGSIYYALRRDRYIPFGPFLAAGGLAVFWFKPGITHFFLETYPRWLSGIV